jgi:hypothetical protein
MFQVMSCGLFDLQCVPRASVELSHEQSPLSCPTHVALQQSVIFYVMSSVLLPHNSGSFVALISGVGPQACVELSHGSQFLSAVVPLCCHLQSVTPGYSRQSVCVFHAFQARCSS